MKSLPVKFVLMIFFVLTFVGQCKAAPKVTQAALIDFKTNDVVDVLAVEDFGKYPSLLLFKENAVIFSAQFNTEKIDTEFGFTNEFLRFKSFNIKGLPQPLLIAMAVSPGGSDEACEVKLIAEKNGKIDLLNSEPIIISIQDGIFVGYINPKYGYGMITWDFQWDAAHYDPHKYKIKIYSWNNKNLEFKLQKEFITKRKFNNGSSALKHYGLPYRNVRDEIITIDEDISTLGIEDALKVPMFLNSTTCPQRKETKCQ